MLESFPWGKLQLSINEKAISFPKSLTEELKKAIYLRNILVHAGTTKPTYQTVSAIIATVSDMLYLLDALSDQQWAIGVVWPETLKYFAAPH